MTKTILLATMAAVMVLGLATASVVINNSVEGAGHLLRIDVRDNVDVENIKLKNGQVRAIVDNAGIGATSDVEITWWFNPEKCVVIAAGDVGGGLGTVELVNDGAFTGLGIPVGHNDVMWAEAILLGVKGDAKECKIDSKKGEYVAVSTVAMGLPGPMVTSNPPP